MRSLRPFLFALILFMLPLASFALADKDASQPLAKEKVSAASGNFDETIFDDKLLIEGYTAKINAAPRDVLLSLINDDSIPAYRKAAAVRVFRDRFAYQMVEKEKTITERFLLRELERAESVYVQIEIMHTLLVMDRYRYFDTMIPTLIQKMDHYEKYAAEIAYASIVHVNDLGNQRAREARIEFNTLRKIFFLTRRKLIDASDSDFRLRNKLELLRWAIKALGTEELKNLPKEVINLM